MDQELASSDDVLIIGGGVIGVCAAYYLAKQGRRVTLVEQGDIAAGSSYGNAGLIVPSYSIPLAAPGVLTQGLRWLLDPESPFFVKPRFDVAFFKWLLQFSLACREGPMRRAIPTLRDLNLLSRSLFDELAALDNLEYGYEQKGSLHIFTTAHGYQEGAAEARLLAEFGLTSVVMDKAQVREFEPSLSPTIVGGVYFASDAHLNPAHFVQSLAAQVAAMGVCLRTQTEVLGFETAGRSIVKVRTTRGDVAPGQIILAAGVWSPRFGRDLGLAVPVQAGKGYSLTLKRPAHSPAVPLLLGEAHVAVTPLDNELRLAGTLELAGLDLSINLRRVRAIERAVREYVPGVAGIEPHELWRGLRPCTPDGLPIIGRTQSCDNLIIATGHAMLGITLGPVTGKLVAQLVCGEKPDLDLRPLRLERF